MRAFGHSTFYDPPNLHASFAWAPKDGIKEDILGLFKDNAINIAFPVNYLRMRVGNKVYRFDL
jgi:hypothetical protein